MERSEGRESGENLFICICWSLFLVLTLFSPANKKITKREEEPDDTFIIFKPKYHGRVCTAQRMGCWERSYFMGASLVYHEENLFVVFFFYFLKRFMQRSEGRPPITFSFSFIPFINYQKKHIPIPCQIRPTIAWR